MGNVTKTVRLRFDNLTDQECRLRFEPLGGSAAIPRGEALIVEVSGPGDGIVEVSYLADGMIVGEWDGAKTTVLNRNGEVVRQE